MAFLLISFTALLGAMIGSFLSVVVARIGTGETIIYGRSHCPHCKKNLHWYELLPVLSFIAQGGQCSSCKAPISWVYPAIEIITASSFGLVAWGIHTGSIIAPAFVDDSLLTAHWLLVIQFLYYSFFAAIAVAISFYDIAHKLIPTILVVPLGIMGLVVTIVGSIGHGKIQSLLIPLAISSLLFLIFWSLWFFSRGRAMGRGDADIAFILPLYLGPLAGLVAVIFSFWLGSIFGILAVGMGRAGFKSEIPFAPFLFAGAILAMFFAPIIAVRFAYFFY